MSQAEFEQLLQALPALSAEQIDRLRRHLDREATAAIPPERPSVFDLLERAGLIGCLEGQPGSPTDLSTNPIYKEGFGRD